MKMEILTEKIIGRQKVFLKLPETVHDVLFDILCVPCNISAAQVNLVKFTTRRLIYFYFYPIPLLSWHRTFDIIKSKFAKLKTPLIREISDEEVAKFSIFISRYAKEHGLSVDTCFEKNSLSEYSIVKASCIDKARLEKVSGFPLDIPPDKNQLLYFYLLKL